MFSLHSGRLGRVSWGEELFFLELKCLHTRPFLAQRFLSHSQAKLAVQLEVTGLVQGPVSPHAPLNTHLHTHALSPLLVGLTTYGTQPREGLQKVISSWTQARVADAPSAPPVPGQAVHPVPTF